MLGSFEGRQQASSSELQDAARAALIEKLKKEREQEREQRLAVEKENRFQKGIIFMMHQTIITRDRAITQKDEELAAKERELNTDQMTGAASERGLKKFIEKRNSQETGDLVVIFFDVDRFKIINDTYGHDVGDDALRAVAEYLKSLFRGESDLIVPMVQTGADYESEVGRPHGDEFIVICANADQEKIMDRLRGEENSLSISHNGKKIPIRLSAGATNYIPGEALKEAKTRADANMYEMKRAHHTEGEDDVI